MLIWQTKTSSNGTYTQQLSPSAFKIDLEDLDSDSYRSITTGNLIDTIISRNWSKISFSYKCLTATQINQLLSIISVNPIYAKIVNPLFNGGFIDAEFRCSKKSYEILETGDYSLSFNLVQKKKIVGQ